jgi:hypothetical protein
MEAIMPNRPYAEAFYEPNVWEESDESYSGVAVLDPLLGQHEVEQTIWWELQQATEGHFSSLIVRRIHDGVCLQGVLETADDGVLQHVDSLVKRVAQVDRVLNQLVVRESRAEAD